MNEVHREFLIETHESLAQLDLDLVALEKDPGERQILARVFRTLHTIKGSAGFLGLHRLQGVAHAAENLLSWLRDGKLTFNEELASVLLRTADAVRQMLAHVESSDTDGVDEFAELKSELESFRSSAPDRPPLAATEPKREPPPLKRDGEHSVALAARPENPALTFVTSQAAAGDAGAARSSAATESSIRVDVGLLDKLMTLVGELVLARNQLVQFGALRDNETDAGALQRLNLLTTELQAGVMKTRMQPIGNLWSKFPRVVRDLAVACGKQAELSMEGQETELDKTIIEAIRDPLTHLVRNAVDHGIEKPDDRLARGKAASGRLVLHAYHEGGKVLIRIADDGGGIDPQQVRAKAIQAKLITPEQGERMADRELTNLIFVPGFSTADRVTQFSGRGVGMDVVRTNVEKIGGTVTIESEPGTGTTVLMKIPLTLAIIPALTVSCAGDRYAIPQVNLMELVHLGADQGRTAIEFISTTPVYRLRGNLLPLVYLKRLLRMDARAESGEADPEASARAGVDIVVLQADDRQFGLVVDSIHDTEEIVVKPLQKQLKSVEVFAGATIMGDGKVALILDVLSIARAAGVISGVRDRAAIEKSTSGVLQSTDRQSVLLFALRDGARLAVPVSQVARLEEFPANALERAGRRRVVQYRGEIMPLIDVARALNRRRRSEIVDDDGSSGGARGSRLHDGSTVQVVVYASDGRHVGLIVDRIIDITEESITVQSGAHRRGVSFTAVVQGQVTEFLDVEALLRDTLASVDKQAQSVAARV
jgi:two-component system chemotaxis sensor kinase CheA